MSKRVLVVVTRAGQGSNMTDATPVVVWEHELPILELVHGQEPEVIEDPEVLVDQAVKVRTEKDGAKTFRPQLVEQAKEALGLGESFTTDPQEEYDRLARVYGMHPQVRMPMVERVYGRFEDGRFAKALGVEALEDMSLAALRERCEKLGVPYEPKDKRPALIAAIRAATTDTQTARELAERHERRVAA